MLMELNPYINKLNSTTEKISFYKYEINILNYYLTLTFDSIEKSLNQCQNLIDILNKQFMNNKKESSIYSETLSTDEKSEDFVDLFKDIYCHKKIGKYHWRIRARKILKYKLKQIIRKKKIPVITKYFGRSKVACLKPRSHGRFVKIN